MVFLGTFALALLLALNALAILDERRFLNRIGWSKSVCESLPATSVKRQCIQLLSAIRTVLRPPLIIVNAVVIIFLLVLG